MPREFGDPTYYYGNPDRFIAWERTRIIRTADLKASPPTWENITGAASGDIRDAQCFIQVDGTAGAWLLTTTGVYWCADVKAASPLWSEVLSLASVVASDVAPPSGSVEIKAICASGSIPGFCIVATGPNNTTLTASYPHAYWWMTSDYGQNWTKTDMAGFLFSDLGVDSGYFLCGLHAIAIQDSTGDIYACRAAARIGTQGRTSIFKSTDLGVTWSQLATIASPSNDAETAPILIPPAPGGIGFVVRGNQAAANPPRLYITSDDFVNVTLQNLPAGYEGVSGVWQPVRVGNQPASLLVWHDNTATGDYDLLYSTDNGTTWQFLLTELGSKLGATAFTSGQCGPIPWPPNPDIWALVSANAPSTPITDAVFYTDDFFANVVDKSGNLEALIGTWQFADDSGFFLPKPAVTLSAYAVADTYHEPAGNLVALDPQPRSKGVEITRRPHSPSGGVKDEELYVWLEWDYFATPAAYQSILTQLGLLNALTNQITISARDQEFTWKRYNGIAVKPQLGQDGEWANYYLRGVKVLVKFLEEIVE